MHIQFWSLFIGIFVILLSCSLCNWNFNSSINSFAWSCCAVCGNNLSLNLYTKSWKEIIITVLLWNKENTFFFFAAFLPFCLSVFISYTIVLAIWFFSKDQKSISDLDPIHNIVYICTSVILYNVLGLMFPFCKGYCKHSCLK